MPKKRPIPNDYDHGVERGGIVPISARDEGRSKTIQITVNRWSVSATVRADWMRFRERRSPAISRFATAVEPTSGLGAWGFLFALLILLRLLADFEVGIKWLVWMRRVWRPLMLA